MSKPCGQNLCFVVEKVSLSNEPNGATVLGTAALVETLLDIMGGDKIEDPDMVCTPLMVLSLRSSEARVFCNTIAVRCCIRANVRNYTAHQYYIGDYLHDALRHDDLFEALKGKGARINAKEQIIFGTGCVVM